MNKRAEILTGASIFLSAFATIADRWFAIGIAIGSERDAILKSP
jgi:hypothetical protein